MNDIIEYDLISVITERVLRDNGIFDLVELTLKKNYHISIDQVLDYPENLKLVLFSIAGNNYHEIIYNMKNLFGTSASQNPASKFLQILDHSKFDHV